MRKKVVALLLVAGMSLSMVGCGSNSDIAELNNLRALNSESTVNSYSLSTSEKEEAVYAQVVARQLLDLTTLDECTDNEKQSVLQFMNNVDSQLCGALDVKNGVIGEDYTNYLLMEFQKTPYYWQRAETVIRGVDAESRSIVVDVTYKTINYDKDIQSASYLVQGEPNYDKKMEIRFDRWLQILNAKYVSQDTSWESDLQEFIRVYGDPKDIFESQRNLTLTESIFETGNQKTYTGLVDSSIEDSFATLTVRFILTPKYSLGINTGLSCNHMYKIAYNIDNDCTEDLELFKDEGYATIADSIYKLIYSYFTCIDESDYNGLYKLTKDFKDLDKHYSDYFETTYRKHEGFTVSLFDIKGSKVKCGVSISSKVRAKGSNMTFPIYTDRYYVELELLDGTLKVTDMILLSTELNGEPAISTSNAQVSGFVSSIDLDNQDKKDIETLISKFGALQLLNDTSSDDFGDVVDMSIGLKQLNNIKENMTSITGGKKVVWLLNYMQGTTNYASVKCRELYQKEDNSIIETDVIYSFINKGNKWYIHSYDINSSVRLDTTNLSTTGSLCVCTAGKVDAFTSQIVNTTGTQSGNTLENIGTTYKHDAYTPVLKTGSTQQGLVQLSPSSIDDAKLKEYYTQLMTTYYTGSNKDKVKDYSYITSQASSLVDADLDFKVKSLVCFYYNFVNNRFNNQSEFDSAKSLVTSSLEDLYEKVGTSGGEFSDVVSCWVKLVDSINK